MTELGHFALLLAWCLAGLQSFCLLRPLCFGAQTSHMIKRASYLQFALLVGAFSSLLFAFIRSDFSVVLVASHSHIAKPLLYKISALWGNHEGSMLLWVLILSLYSAAFAKWGRIQEALKIKILSLQGLVSFGFLGFVILTSNPFRRALPAPFQGAGFNPILQDPALAFHPPFLYLGYVGTSLGFSFALAVLLKGKGDENFAPFLRSWVLCAWVFLTLGIGMGSFWAYYELGWGGFWFWDPVENASLMPWLVLTALLHSLIITAKGNSSITQDKGKASAFIGQETTSSSARAEQQKSFAKQATDSPSRDAKASLPETFTATNSSSRAEKQKSFAKEATDSPNRDEKASLPEILTTENPSKTLTTTDSKTSLTPKPKAPILLGKWSLFLAVSAFGLSIVGTFLVRSGVLTSVHSFAHDPKRGVFILGLLGFYMGLGYYLFAKRARQYPSHQFLLFSRQSALILNNVFLLSALVAVFIGTLYPLFIDVLGLDKISVGAPYFNLVLAPLLLPLFILLPFAPFLKWAGGIRRKDFLVLCFFLIFAVVGGILCGMGQRDISLWSAIAIWIFCGAAIDAIHKRKNLLSALSAPLAHAGVGILLFGIMASSFWQKESIYALAVGEDFSIGAHHLTFDKLENVRGKNYTALRGHFLLRDKDGKAITTLRPETRHYNIERSQTNEVALYKTFYGNLYLVLGEEVEASSQEKVFAVRAWVHPFIWCIWGGGLLMAMGGFVALLRRARARVRTRFPIPILLFLFFLFASLFSSLSLSPSHSPSHSPLFPTSSLPTSSLSPLFPTSSLLTSSLPTSSLSPSFPTLSLSPSFPTSLSPSLLSFPLSSSLSSSSLSSLSLSSSPSSLPLSHFSSGLLVSSLLFMSSKIFTPSKAFGIVPDEVLQDEALEARARDLFDDVRCLVCEGQSLDESNADLAKDIRVFIRRELAKGASNQEVRDLIQARYGEYALLKPLFSLKNLFLWVAPFFVLGISLIFVFLKLLRV